MSQATWGAMLTSQNQRDFSEGELPHVRTVVRAALPFLLPGLRGKYEVTSASGEALLVEVVPEQVPRQAAEAVLRGQLSGPGVAAAGDHWGRLNYSVLVVVLPLVLPLRSEMVHLHDDKWIDRPSFEEIVDGCLGRFLDAANMLIDAHASAAKSYFTRRLVREDVFGFDAFHHLLTAGPSAFFNILRAPFQSPLELCHPRHANWHILTQADLQPWFPGADAHSMYTAIRLNARRALAVGNVRIAVVDTATALERVVSSLVRKRSTARGISKKTLDDLKRDITLSMELKILLPLLLDEVERPPDSVIRRANELRKLRNDLIHEPAHQDLDRVAVSQLVDDVLGLCDRLEALA